MGELSLIQTFRAHAPTHPWVIVGPGHDCAVLRWPGERDQAFKIDQVSEGAHFTLTGNGAISPYQAGWKAMAKTCSDIAATGFWPVAATVAVNIRKGTSEKFILELYEGITACCRKYSFGLAGGDLCVSENGLHVTVSLLGEGPKGGAWLRSGAKVGDALVVTGTLGGSQRSGKHFNFEPRLEAARYIRDAIPTGVHACIDITDGLSRDLLHLCDESKCGAVLYEDKIPCTGAAGGIPPNSAMITAALGEGEDFELLFAIDPKSADQLLAHGAAQCEITCIGQVCEPQQGCTLVDAKGARRPMPNVGFEHCP